MFFHAVLFSVNPIHCAKYELIQGEVETIDDGSEYKVFRSQQCMLLNNPVDISFCVDDPTAASEEVFEWYIFPSAGRPWNTAGQTCEDLGGILFGQLNGTVAQLEFFFERLDRPATYHIGATNSENEFVWKDLRGEDITDKIVWYGDEPNQGADMVLVVSSMGVWDGTGMANNRFACNMAI